MTVPVKFYSYEEMPDCSDSSKSEFKSGLAALLGIADPATITVSCRFAAPSTGDAFLRRMLRAAQYLVSGCARVCMWVPAHAGARACGRVRVGGVGYADNAGGRCRAQGAQGWGRMCAYPHPNRCPAHLPPPPPATASAPTTTQFSTRSSRSRRLAETGAQQERILLSVTTPTQQNPALAADAFCQKVVGSMGGSNCTASEHLAATRVTVTQSQKGDTSADACSGAQAAGQQALKAQLGLSKSDVQPISCKATVVNFGVAGVSAPPPPSPGVAPPGDSGSVSVGLIVGVTVGAVAAVLIAAVVAVTVRKKMRERGTTSYVPRTAAAGASGAAAGGDAGPGPSPTGAFGRLGTRWKTYSMEVKAQQARSGRGAVAGVSHYT